MAYRRSVIPFFAVANRAYINAAVTFYALDSDYERTSTKVTLYDSKTAGSTFANPITLDSDGKFSSAVYVDEPTLGVVGLSDGTTHDTGIFEPALSAADVTAAAASALAAANSATDADGSATAAAASENAAATSETNAAASENAAADSASNAATSESNAADSAEEAAQVVGTVAYHWAFEASTVMGDPGTGDLRFDTTALGSITNVALSDFLADTGNPDVGAVLDSWDDSTSTASKGTLTVRKLGDDDFFLSLRVTSVTDNTSWHQLAVTVIGTGGGTLTAADDLYLAFAPAGDAGVAGLVLISGTDTTGGYAEDKFTAGTGVDIEKQDSGGDESLLFSVDTTELEEFLALAGKLTDTFTAGTNAMTARRRYRITGGTATLPTLSATDSFAILECAPEAGTTVTIDRNVQTINGTSEDRTWTGAGETGPIMLFSYESAGAVTMQIIGSTAV